MYRGTTPTLVFTVTPELDLSALAEAWLTIRQAEVEITHSLPDLVPTEGGFSVTLTQAETLGLSASASCRVQLRALTGAGQAMASNILSLPVGGILKCGVIGPDPPTQPTPTVRPAALPLPLNLADPDIRLTLALDAVNTGGGTSYKIGHGLKVEDGTLMVDTADAVEQDNTLPVTSAAVFVQTGNIEALLAAL